MSLRHRPCLDDSWPDLSFAACPRPPIPGREDDSMPTDSFDTRDPHLDSFEDSRDGNGGGGEASAAGNSFETNKRIKTRHESLTAVEGCFAGNHNTNTTLETNGYGAALSHEPDGNSVLATCARWTESLDSLLDDQEGVRLFQEFLSQENDVKSLEFWFACRGLKMNPLAERDQILGLVKYIFRRYVKGDALRLKPEIKRRIVERIQKSQVDPGIFDEAKVAIETIMRNDFYPLFLKSDLYVQYLQAGQESPKATNESGESGAPFQRAGAGISNLPTLHEDEELATNDLNDSSVSAMSLTSSSLLATRKAREGFHQTQYYRCGYPGGSGSRLSNPYHVSYAPVSAQDSELQSLSSDALTDDTLSHTESSVDGRDYVGYASKNIYQKQVKAMRRYAKANQETDLQLIQQFVPRTERVPVDSNLAKVDPERFATLLIEKLAVVKEEQDKMELVEKSIRSIQVAESDNPVSYPLFSRSDIDRSRNFSFASMLLASTVGDATDIEDNAQSILDDHVSHVWNSSGATPSRSPGCHTPKFAQNDLTRLPPGSSVLLPAAQKSRDFVGTTFQTPAHNHAVPRDSRFVPPHDFGPMQAAHRHGQRHHHHHHHHHHPSKDLQFLPPELDLSVSQHHHPAALGRNGVPWTHAVDSAKQNARKNVDGSSKFADVNGERLPHHPEPGQNDVHAKDSTKERVLMWMLASEKYCSDGVKDRCSTDGSDKGSSSNKRSSHKSGAKKGVGHRGNRSESLDRTRLSTSLTEHPAGYPPANHMLYSRTAAAAAASGDGFVVPSASAAPSAHFDAARTRLTEEGRLPPTKSRSDQNAEPMLPPQTANIPVHNFSAIRSIPLPSGGVINQSSLEILLSNSQKSDSKLGAVRNAVTVIGYYFCDEPIPYRSTIPGNGVTLGQFKQLISKRGNFRYFFKRASDEFESGVVHDEVTCDNAILPLWEGKVVGKVERIKLSTE